MGLVIEKTARILRLVQENEPCSLKELTALAGMKKPTLFLILKSLVKVGYLEKSPDNMYSLGPTLFDLTSTRRFKEKRRQLTISVAENLSRRLNEAVTIACMRDLSYCRLASVDSRQTVKVDRDVLEDTSFFRNATGRILLAHADAATLDSLLAEFGLPSPDEWDGVDEKKTLLAELAKIRSEGIAYRRLPDDQVLFVAAPAFDKQGSRILAIGVSVPIFRFERQQKEVVDSLIQACKDLTRAFAEASSMDE